MADVTVFLTLYFIISISIHAPPLKPMQLSSSPNSHSLTLTLHMRASARLTISIYESAPVSIPAEILEEHFTRHSKGGKSTKVIVFTQLRATVRAIVADLADTKGV
jgi:ERCC4-related helicase